jgi:YVTN family beta-propeller protein
LSLDERPRLLTKASGGKESWFVNIRTTNMTNMQVFRASLSGLAGILLCTVSVSFLAAQESNTAVYAAMKGAAKLRMVQTNFAGDVVSIIDPATNKVVGEIPGIEMGHGINVAKDNSQIYIAQESTASLLVVDGKTLQITKRIPLSGSPNLVQLTPDGKRMYVSINLRWDVVSNFPQLQAEPSGGIDIIDVASLEKIKTISIPGGIHDMYITPDGKYVVAGANRNQVPACKCGVSAATNLGSVIDTQTNETAWTWTMSPVASPMAISKKPDGSTDKIYAQNGGDNGFRVIDFDTHVVSSFVKLPDIAPALQNRGGSHGIGITADQKTLLVNSGRNSAVYAYSLPDLKLLGGAQLSGKGANWLVITPDDKTVYVANPETNNVSVVDIATMKETGVIPVGFAPSRNTMWVAP